MHTVLEAIGTANPPFRLTQSEAAAFMAQVSGLSAATQKRLTSIYGRSGIDYRYTCVADYGQSPENFEFYPTDWSLQPAPSTADRNRLYRNWANQLAEQAAQAALDRSQRSAAEITHLVCVSCTGFGAPGVDVHLIQTLGLPATTDRTLIGFMGCHGAFNGLKVAHALCQSDPQAKVLLVCVELCSLHLQIEDSLESVVINALFGDGAGAAVLTSRSEPAEAAGHLVYRAGGSWLLEDSLDLMSWTIGDTGFLMELAAAVPQRLASHLPAYLAKFLGRQGLGLGDLDFWAVHPGGRQILDQVQALFQLTEAQIRDSYGILRQYGNMSSATILFILQGLLDRHRSGQPFDHGLAMAFGPGLTIEACLFQGL